MSVPVRIVDAWNGRYRVNGNTRGTWVRGEHREMPFAPLANRTSPA